MVILGIESSCDDSGIAILEDGKNLLHNKIYSQTDIHASFGGIVPEVAARQHVSSLGDLIQEIKDLNMLNVIQGVAVTKGPGLAGSLLVGINYAKSLAYALNVPVRGINHLTGHIHAAWIENQEEIEFPVIALLVSGGHSELVFMKSHKEKILLGLTRDDAAGEVFDKVARFMDLEYPGGPVIDKRSQLSKSKIRTLPVTNIKDSLDYSFSGLKTSTIKYISKIIEQNGQLDDNLINDICYNFQDAVVEQLVIKLKMAVEEYKPKSIIVCGGVAANSHLRARIKNESAIPVIIPSPKLCTDNGAMIAAAAFYENAFSKESELDLDVFPSLKMTD